MNYKMGRQHQTNNQMIIFIEDCDSKEEALKLVGKEVIFTTKTGNTIKGIVRSSHGNKGNIRVLFEKGMPGQALNAVVKIN